MNVVDERYVEGRTKLKDGAASNVPPIRYRLCVYSSRLEALTVNADSGLGF